MSTEIYFLQDKNKKKGGTKRRRYFLLEKHLDGNDSRSSKARSNAWMGAAQWGRVPGSGSAWIRPRHQASPVCLFDGLGKSQHWWPKMGWKWVILKQDT